MKASAENGTAELAQAEANGAAIANAPATVPAISAPFKNLRVKIIVNSVAGLRPGHPAIDSGVQALELRFRSSQAIVATSDANFGIKGALANIGLE